MINVVNVWLQNICKNWHNHEMAQIWTWKQELSLCSNDLIFVSPLYENVISHFKGWHHLTTVPSSQCCFFPVRPLTSQTSQEVSVCLPSCGPPVPVPLHWSASVLPVVCVVISYEGIAIFVFAVQDDHQRMVLHSLVAPLVCVLKPWLEEVETGSEAGQHQDRHQQVDGDEPVQEHPGHGTVMERYRRRKGDIRLWADDEIPNTIYLLYTWCSFTCKHTTYSQSQVKYYVQASALSK